MSTLVGLAILAFATAAQALGYAHDVTGTVTFRSSPKQQERLKVGDLVRPGQTIVTEEASSAVLKFEDGQIIALGEQSSVTIQEYSYNKSAVGKSRAAFELQRGSLRFITGVIGATNHDAVRFSAGGTTVQIRGTDASLVLDARTRVVTAAVNAGGLLVANALSKQAVDAGSFTTASPNRPLTSPAPLALAAPSVQRIMTDLARRPNVPVNTPVVAQASARAVIAQAQVRALQQQAAQQPNNGALQQQVQQAQQQAALAVREAVSASQSAYQTVLSAGALTVAPPGPPPAEPVQAAAPQAAVQTTDAQQPAAETTPPPQPQLTPAPIPRDVPASRS